MGQSQSTRRGTPSHRLPRSSGRNKTEDSEVSETTITNEERTKSENTVSNENIESNANDEKSENNMKHSIPILTVTGKLTNRNTPYGVNFSIIPKLSHSLILNFL